MATRGRSLDDLPLAAYTTGMTPDAPDEVVEEYRASGDAARMMPVDAGTEFEPGPDDELEPAPAADGPAVLVRARAFATRNPRVAAGGLLVLVVIAGFLVMGSGAAGPAVSATATQSAPPTVTVVADPGAATITLTGALNTELVLTAPAGATPAGATAITATWMDGLQNAISLTGPVDRGTRTTDTRLVLRLTMMIDGLPVTFTSKAGECTIGMAVMPANVTGSFTCHKLKSESGKLVLNASGTYRT
jgi:hypothetical protein